MVYLFLSEVFFEWRGFLISKYSETGVLFSVVVVEYPSHGICSSGSGFIFSPNQLLGEVLSSQIEQP